MEYDKKIHLAQQIEFFLNGFASGDSVALERVLSNIKDILDDTDVAKKIDLIDKNKANKINDIKQKAVESLKTLVETKNSDELFIDIEEIFRDTETALNTLEIDYWEKIREYILKSVDQDEK